MRRPINLLFLAVGALILSESKLLFDVCFNALAYVLLPYQSYAFVYCWKNLL